MPFDPTPVPTGTDIQVNTTTAGAQRWSSVAALDDGGFVVTWSSLQPDGSGYDIHGQRYNASGAKAGNEFLVNLNSFADQRYSAVTPLEGGGFAVTWTVFSAVTEGAPGAGAYIQRYDKSGAEVGTTYVPFTGLFDARTSTSITGLNDGGFVVTWSSLSTPLTDIFGQRFDAAGAETGAPFYVTLTSGLEDNPSVTSLNDGGFVVTWSSQDGSGWGIFGRLYDAAGLAVGNQFRANTIVANDQLYQSVVSLNDGGFVVTWSSRHQDSSEWGVYGQRYDAAGTKVGTEFLANTALASDQLYPSVTSLHDGGFVVTWSSYGQDGSSYGIFGQRFDASGTTIGDEFHLNATTTGNQIAESFYGSETVATLADGRLVATWSGQGTEEVFIRLIDVPSPTTRTVSTESQVNAHTPNNQLGGAVAGLAGGGHVVVWTSEGGQDGSGAGVYSQRYDAAGNKVGPETLVNT